MSSTITQSELQTVPKSSPAMPSDKPKRELTRSTSLEKIRKFNSFICSQNYYILPSLLAWLKTSQTVLQRTAEKTMFHFKYLLVSGLLHLQAWTLRLSGAIFEDLKRRLFVLAVYASLGFILLQLLACAYLLCVVFLPAGFVFLVVCLYSVCHLGYRLNAWYAESAERKMRAGGNPGDARRESRPRKRDVLKGRSYSNFNLF